ncbi:hypothetical protein [Rhizobium sp. Root482]|uniref:hypothetical protein n=1 Tax=Rhizobium sp. Root482 TaxID=1736543 RepID=UPI0006F678BF|nr:hypothetical protein [Rhizobium sp. Root482]KQY12268.1 hypothetical protein ASD31_17035 [Rhizobium sp. Root482]
MIHVVPPTRPVGHPDRTLDCEEALEKAVHALDTDETLSERDIEAKLIEGGLAAGWTRKELGTAIADLRRNAAVQMQRQAE